MSCTAVAPVPMIPIRRLARSQPSSQAVVWMIRPLKLVMPWMSGVFGWDREAGRGDQEATGQRLAVGQGHLPDQRVVVPTGSLDRRVEPHVAAYVVFVGDVVGVVLQLRAGREQPRPVRVRLEPVGIGRRGNVDGKPRIAVYVPGST